MSMGQVAYMSDDLGLRPCCGGLYDGEEQPSECDGAPDGCGACWRHSTSHAHDVLARLVRLQQRARDRAVARREYLARTMYELDTPETTIYLDAAYIPRVDWREPEHLELTDGPHFERDEDGVLQVLTEARAAELFEEHEDELWQQWEDAQ